MNKPFIFLMLVVAFAVAKDNKADYYISYSQDQGNEMKNRLIALSILTLFCISYSQDSAYSSNKGDDGRC